ncbi:MAG: S41 family peptidase [Isosphaeraceae bacterium]
MDVYSIPAAGGEVKPLTTHSADDTVIGWTPTARPSSSPATAARTSWASSTPCPSRAACPAAPGLDRRTGSFSPDGHKIAVNRKAQQYWRKHYRGAYQSDVTVMDVAAKSFKDLTDFDGMDSWPMWGRDGFIYFVSDRDPNGQANLWRVPESGGPAEKVTDFTSGDVRFPSISADGKTIVFERDFGISKLDLATRKVTPLRFDIIAEAQESLTEYRDFDSTVDDYDVAPDGRRVVFSVHGELFSAPTGDSGDLRQITDGAARDQNVEYSPDGKLVAYVSDANGREEIYVVPAEGDGTPKKITDVDALKSSMIWSPDSKSLAFTTSDGKLYTITAEGKDLKEVVASKYGSINRPAWSPDGKWLAYSRNDVSRSSDVYLIPAAGGEEHKITFDSSNEMSPQFSSDAKKVYFVRVEGEMFGSERPSAQIFCVPLEKLDRDPDEADAASEGAGEGRRGGMAPGAGGPGMAAGMGMGPRAATPPKEPKIDWAGLKRRTRQVTRMPSPVFNYIPANDGRTLIFVSSEGGGAGGSGGGRRGGFGGGTPSIYTITDDGKRMNRLTTGAAPSAGDGDDDAPRGPRGFFGGGISGLNLTRDGRTLYFQEGDRSPASPSRAAAGRRRSGGFGGFAGRFGGGGGVGAPGGGNGGTDAASGAAAGGASRRRVSFSVSVKVEKPKEWEEMFDDAWRTMKYRFYDPKMHGKDWDAMRAKYRPVVAFVGDRPELMNVINEMIGEVKASHTGAAAGATATAGRGGPRGAGGPSTGTKHLGIDLAPDEASGKYRVAHVYEDGPADKDWIKVSKGDYLIAVDGKPVKAGDDYWKLLGRRLNRKVELTLNSKPEADGAWKVKYEPISMSAFGDLRYERWVKERRALVDKLTDGRVGYLHIKAMDQPSLARFKKELAEYRHKDGLVIDERWNGGGNIEQELLAILVQRPYQVWQPRGTEPTSRPFAGYFGPKVVLQNWRSASNAEMFPAGFRALGLGKVVGTQTMGAVIGTGSYRLIDGSTVRTPGVGVFLADEARTNMENTGVKPDVYVENTPEDNLAGRDRQLETAAQEVLKSLKKPEHVAGPE